MYSGLAGRAWPIDPPNERLAPGDTVGHFVLELIDPQALNLTRSYLLFMKWIVSGKDDVFKVVLVELRGAWTRDKILDVQKLKEGVVLPPKVTTALEQATPQQAVWVLAGITEALVNGRVKPDLMGDPTASVDWQVLMQQLWEKNQIQGVD